MKEPRDAMRVFGAASEGALDAAARLGGAEERLGRERAYLIKALRALLGEHGDEAVVTHRSITLRGSGVTIVVKRSKMDGEGVGCILLEYGKARRGKERDAKYFRGAGAWNVQRVAARAFLLHERWLEDQRQAASAEARREAARRHFLAAYNELVRPEAPLPEGHAGGVAGVPVPGGAGVVEKSLSWEVSRLGGEGEDAEHALHARVVARGPEALRRALAALRSI